MKNSKILHQDSIHEDFIADYLIVGAGASGVYASDLLQKKFEAKSVLILEKSRGVGGRLATRRLTLDNGITAEIDLGAVVVHRPFRSTLLVEPSLLDITITSWECVDVLEGLSNRFLKHIRAQASQVLLQCETQVTSTQYEHQAGVWTVNCTQPQAQQGDSHEQQLVNRQFLAKQLVLAMPAPQVSMLLNKSKNIGEFPLEKVSSVDMVCRWTWVLAVEGNKMLPQSVYRPIGHDMIETVFVISQKPGVAPIEGVHLLHVSMTLQWSSGCVNVDKKVAAEQWNIRIIEALSDIIGAEFIGKCIGIHGHKWLYGHTKNPLKDGFLVNDRQDLWCVGDWLAGYGLDDSLYSAEQMVLSTTSD